MLLRVHIRWLPVIAASVCACLSTLGWRSIYSLLTCMAAPSALSRSYIASIRLSIVHVHDSTNVGVVCSQKHSTSTQTPVKVTRNTSHAYFRTLDQHVEDLIRIGHYSRPTQCRGAVSNRRRVSSISSASRICKARRKLLSELRLQRLEGHIAMQCYLWGPKMIFFHALKGYRYTVLRHRQLRGHQSLRLRAKYDGLAL